MKKLSFLFVVFFSVLLLAIGCHSEKNDVSTVRTLIQDFCTNQVSGISTYADASIAHVFTDEFMKNESNKFITQYGRFVAFKNEAAVNKVDSGVAYAQEVECEKATINFIVVLDAKSNKIVSFVYTPLNKM